jgi:hypothetical protein
MSIGMLPPNIRDEGLPPVNRPPVITPTVDPNFVSGFNYARSIAGGLPMEQVIAPGVSFSPDQPSGFTQMDLNAPVTTTATPPVQQDIIMDDTSPDYSQLPPNIIGGGRGDNITILQDQMRFPPPRDILGGFNFIPQIDVDVLRQGLRDEISSLIPPQEQPDLTKFISRDEIDTLLSQGPTGGRLSIERQDMPEIPDVSKFVTQKDIDQAIQNIDIPTMPMMPDLTPFDQRLASLEQGLFDLQQRPTGGRFSIERQDPMGLFA